MGKELSFLDDAPPKTQAEIAARARTKTRQVIATARRYGYEYFDGDRKYGIGTDARIGSEAYLRPGHPNQHLQRDLDTIEKLRTSS